MARLLRAWAGDAEPDWGCTDLPLGYAYQVPSADVVNNRWLDVFARAARSAAVRQLPARHISEIVTDIPYALLEPDPTWAFKGDLDWHQHLEKPYGRARALSSIARLAKLCIRHPSEDECAEPVDWATLRWYDIDYGRDRGWFRRCVVWRYRNDPARDRKLKVGDEDYVRRIGSTGFSHAEQTQPEYVFTEAAYPIEGVQAVHYPLPDWRPERPSINSYVYYLLKAMKAPSGLLAMDDPNFLDRLFLGEPNSLSAWTEFEQANETDRDIGMLSQAVTIIRFWCAQQAARLV